MSGVSECGRHYAVCTHVDITGPQIKAFPMRCKRWDCPSCRKTKSVEAARRTANLFVGKRVSMFTVTMSHSETLEVSYRDIARRWNRFRTALVARWGRISYVRILEPQPRSGYPHYHILVDRYVPAWWLNAELRRSQLGRIMDIGEVTSPEAQSYVRKYLRKPWQSEAGSYWARTFRLRRFSSSRDSVRVPKSPKDWLLVCIYGDRQFALKDVYMLSYQVWEEVRNKHGLDASVAGQDCGHTRVSGLSPPVGFGGSQEVAPGVAWNRFVCRMWDGLRSRGIMMPCLRLSRAGRRSA